MEKKWFNWQYCDQLDTMCFSFMDCILIRPIGDLSIGQIVNNIIIDYELGEMQIKILEDDDESIGFDLNLIITESKQ